MGFYRPSRKNAARLARPKKLPDAICEHCGTNATRESGLRGGEQLYHCDGGSAVLCSKHFPHHGDRELFERCWRCGCALGCPGCCHVDSVEDVLCSCGVLQSLSALLNCRGDEPGLSIESHPAEWLKQFHARGPRKSLIERMEEERAKRLQT